MKTNKLKTLLLSVLLLPVIPALSADSFDAAARQNTLTRLQHNGADAATAQVLLAPVERAAEMGLPWAVVCDRVEEGVVKQAPRDRILAAANLWVQDLDQARTLLQESGYAEDGVPQAGLLRSTAQALESGVPQAALQSVLKQGGGRQAGRMQSVVEAGESLQLSGMEPDQVQALMLDCTARNLRRMEVLRVVRFAQQQHREGVDGASIRRMLWSSGGGAIRAPCAAGQDAPAAGPGGRGEGKAKNTGGAGIRTGRQP